jgi:aminomethyltransferase
MKQTILHQKHLQIKAKMTDFQGWQIPLLFSEGQDEYHAVRTSAGLFDVSYLGRIGINGAGASTLLQNILTYNTAKITEGSAHYSLVCNESGAILDDVLIFHLPNGASGRRYMLTTNAINTEKILLWLGKHATNDVQIADNTQTIAQFALQGPQSFGLLEKLIASSFKKFKPKTAREMTMLDTPVIVSRTGYTGELGYEFFMPAERAENIWDAIMSAGRDAGLLPCGFAARDILRLEKGYLLYGNDIDETRTPLEAGLGSFVDFKKDFIGKDALVKIAAEGVKQKLAGFELLDQGVPKSGGSIFSENREIGTVTSGGQSSHVRKGIGLGYVVSRYAQPGQEIEIEIKDREIAAKIVALPFYKKK